MEKSSLVYVRTVSATQTESQLRDRVNLLTPRYVPRYWQSSNTPMNGRAKSLFLPGQKPWGTYKKRTGRDMSAFNLSH